MLKRDTYFVILILFTATLYGCENTHVNENMIPQTQVTNSDNDTLYNDIFKNAIDSLTKLNYYISGRDSIVLSKTPTDFVEMNIIRYCFEFPFNKTDSGLYFYNQTLTVRKFHIAKNKIKDGPSANLIQISFKDAIAAKKWYDKLTDSKMLEAAKMKPKTDIWQQDQYVYFIQSYYDPDGIILKTIETNFKIELMKQIRKHST